MTHMKSQYHAVHSNAKKNLGPTANEVVIIPPQMSHRAYLLTYLMLLQPAGTSPLWYRPQVQVLYTQGRQTGGGGGWGGLNPPLNFEKKFFRGGWFPLN